MHETATPKEANTGTSRNLMRFLLILSAIGSACILGQLLKFSHYGIDFTDEGFYLAWISNPFIYDRSIYLFGFVYHPLYLLLDGNVAALRQANILITFSLGWLLVDVFFKKIAPISSSLERLIISAAFATATLVFLNTWLPTPSYNSLALQALLIVVTGLLLAESATSYPSILGWVLIGLGGWLALMSKPSTAAALAICVIAYLLFARKLNIRLLLISIGTAITLLMMSALAIDRSLAQFIDRIKIGIEYLGYLGGGHTFSQIVRLDDFQLTTPGKIVLSFIAVLSFISARLISSERYAIKVATQIFLIIFFSIALILFTQDAHTNIDLGSFQGLVIWAIPLSGAAIGLAACQQKIFINVSKSNWLLAITLIAFPYVYAFGSNDNYWHASSSAGLFWLIAGLILAAPAVHGKNKLAVFLPLALATQTIVVMLVQSGLETPYRQTQALRLNNHPVDIGKPGSTLILSKEYAKYLNEAVVSAKHVGLKLGTPVIDLSGRSPGILYAMNVENTGQAWMIGGYPGSLKLATAALRHVACDKIATAWLLIEPGGPRSISDTLLTSFGANLAENYKLVATWKTARGAGGYPQRRLQMLLMPIRNRNDAIRACEDERKKLIVNKM